MDLAENRSNHPNIIKSANAESCVIGDKTFCHTVVIPSNGDITTCQITDVSQLTDSIIKQLCANQPELIVLATGQHIKYPDPAVLEPLIKMNIGLEILSNQAAARTFNVLLAEDRNAVCLMLLG